MPGRQREAAEEACADAYARLQEVGGELDKLAEPFRTIVVVDTALAIIANGGAEYFFEADFPGQPDYALFSNAFRGVGLRELAGQLDGLVGMFPFEDPQARKQERVAFMSHQPESFTAACNRFDEMAWAVDVDAVIAQYLGQDE